MNNSMVGLIAKKSGMSQIVLDNGDATAVTLFKIEPNVVTQVKSLDQDGYQAIQVGSGARKRYNRAQQGHLKELDARIAREVRVQDISKYKRGDKLDVSLFAVGDLVSVRGITKGKGFAGTIKRHGFKSGPGSHGHDHHRQPGSIGAMGMPRVHKGKRMAGHMGSQQVTVKNLQVVAVDVKSQTVAVKGATPGANQGWVLMKKHESR